MAWHGVARIPIDGTTSGVDHFTPALAVDRSTSDAGASIGVSFYFSPTADCSTSTCW